MHKIILLLLSLLLASHAQTLPKEVDYKEVKRIYSAGSGLFIDARGAKFYAQGTILGAINMPIERFMRMKRLLPGKKGSKLVVFCNGIKCSKSTRLTQKIASLGYSRVMVYRGGYPEWREKGQDIMLSQKYCHSTGRSKKEVTVNGVKVYLGRDEGMIDTAWFAQQYQEGTLPKNIALVDVRREEAFKKGHLPGATHVRWDSDKGEIDTNAFPKDKLLLLYCNTGLLSSDAYDSLDEETAKRVLFLNTSVKCQEEKCEIKSFSQ